MEMLFARIAADDALLLRQGCRLATHEAEDGSAVFRLGPVRIWLLGVPLGAAGQVSVKIWLEGMGDCTHSSLGLPFSLASST